MRGYLKNRRVLRIIGRWGSLNECRTEIGNGADKVKEET